jgi:hypothetical protein
MESFTEAERRKPKHRPPPEVWTRKDKLVVCGAFAAALCALLGGPILKSVISHRTIVNRRLETWKTRFELSSAEIGRLREIESSFHGSGFAFTAHTRSHQQIDAHKQELSRAMNPESAMEFINYYQNKHSCGRQ